MFDATLARTIDGPGAYRVLDRIANKSHGNFATLEEARGCVRFDRLKAWTIEKDGMVVDYAEVPVLVRPACSGPSTFEPMSCNACSEPCRELAPGRGMFEQDELTVIEMNPNQKHSLALCPACLALLAAGAADRAAALERAARRAREHAIRAKQAARREGR